MSGSRCGVVAERGPWGALAAFGFSTTFEDAVAGLTQRCERTSSTELRRRPGGHQVYPRGLVKASAGAPRLETAGG